MPDSVKTEDTRALVMAINGAIIDEQWKEIISSVIYSAASYIIDSEPEFDCAVQGRIPYRQREYLHVVAAKSLATWTKLLVDVISQRLSACYACSHLGPVWRASPGYRDRRLPALENGSTPCYCI